MPVRIRLVTPISMGRKLQLIAQTGVVARRERAAEREFGDAGSNPASGFICRGSSVGERVHSQFVSYPSAFLLAAPLRLSFLSIRLLDAIDVDFLHLHHRLHDVFRLRRIFVVKIIEENRGADLPGDAEFVSQPAAGDFLAAG